MKAPVGAIRDPYINPGAVEFCWLGNILFAPRLTRIDGTRPRKSGWCRKTGSRLVSGLRLAWVGDGVPLVSHVSPSHQPLASFISLSRQRGRGEAEMRVEPIAASGLRVPILSPFLLTS